MRIYLILVYINEWMWLWKRYNHLTVPACFLKSQLLWKLLFSVFRPLLTETSITTDTQIQPRSGFFSLSDKNCCEIFFISLFRKKDEQVFQSVWNPTFELHTETEKQTAFGHLSPVGHIFSWWILLKNMKKKLRWKAAELDLRVLTALRSR